MSQVNSWRTELRRLQIDLSSREIISYKAHRLALGQLWLTLQSVPDPIFLAYREMPEERLVEASEKMGPALAEGRLEFRESASPEEIALLVGAQLRALENVLVARPGFAHPPSSPDSYLVPEIDAFIIPRRDSKLQDGKTGPGRGLGRRATPRHRIIPRTVDDYNVELVWDTRLSAGHTAGRRRALGAALLPGMTLTRDPAQKKWVALAADCPQQSDLIAGHVRGSHDDGAMAVVYPELSMPPHRLLLLQAELGGRSRLMEPGSGPALVAAGSWHENDGRGVRNVMRVLDKTGVERMRYAKSIPYFRDGLHEGIVADRNIPVLVNTDFLATFAICLDFCERELAIPYDRLDVDLVLVASQGNERTMKGHEANAEKLGIKHGGETFVVQHGEKGHDPVGYVFPREEHATDARENRSWSTRLLSFI